MRNGLVILALLMLCVPALAADHDLPVIRLAEEHRDFDGDGDRDRDDGEAESVPPPSGGVPDVRPTIQKRSAPSGKPGATPTLPEPPIATGQAEATGDTGTPGTSIDTGHAKAAPTIVATK